MTDLVAAEIRTSVPVRYCGLIQKVPVIEVGKELGTLVEQSAEVSQHESCDWVGGSGESTSREGASLINSTVGTDLGIRGHEVHPVLCGASVPSGEDSSKVRISVLSAVDHGTPGDILEGRLEIKGNQHSSKIRVNNVSDGLDHGVDAVLSSHAVLNKTGTFGHRFHHGCHD